MQATELEKTTQALELQVQEMKLALIQQTALAETTKEDLDLSKQVFKHQIKIQEINAQPFFHFGWESRFYTSENSDGKFLIRNIKRLSLSNSRAPCRQIEIYVNNNDQDILISTYGYLKNHDTVSLDTKNIPRIEIHEQTEIVELRYKLIIKYLDELDNSQKQEFELCAKMVEKSDIELEFQKITF